MDIPISLEQWEEWHRIKDNPNRPSVQVMFPDLSADQREFLLTGMSPEEWDEMVGTENPDDEEEYFPSEEEWREINRLYYLSKEDK